MKLYCWILLVSFVMSLDWNSWMSEYKRNYKSLEEQQYRHQIWKNTLKEIEAHNTKNFSWIMGLNQFSDLTKEEYKNRLSSSPPFPSDVCSKLNTGLTSNVLPAYVNWIDRGAVTPVRDVGDCRSDFGFAATASLEGRWQIATGTLYTLSVQEIIDCTLSEGNAGCSYGLVDFTYNYTKQHGLCTDEDYPYMGLDHRCLSTKCKSVINTTGCVNLWGGNKWASELTLQLFTSMFPVSVYIDASLLRNYKSGIIDDPNCYFSLTTAMTVVGYNDSTAEDNHWIIKSSLSSSWGEKGYARIRMGKCMCGICFSPSFPTLIFDKFKYN